MNTFTFPSGATVDLPEGLPLCQDPETGSRHLYMAGPATCWAYRVAGEVYTMRETIAADRKRVEVLRRRGRTWNAGNLQRNADERETRDARLLSAWVADAHPCSCA
jgi:hypothetical protein